jgi:hypothetical protein
MVNAHETGYGAFEFLAARPATPASVKMRSNALRIARRDLSVNVQQQLFVGEMGIIVHH